MMLQLLVLVLVAVLSPTLCLDLPEPRLVIIGQTGAGKSTLANVLLGQNPDCKNCTFAVCDSHDSCTKNTNYAVGSWLGSGDHFTVVDTPGFGDSDQEDTELIDEMMGTLHTVIEGANALVLLLNGAEERFDASFQQMLREMQALFGEDFWLNTVIGVSHWDYKAGSIAQRNYTNATEENFMAEMNELLMGKFHIKEELMGVFIDAWSQQPWNLNDQDQQDAFERETSKLLEFAKSKETFAFRTIEDVLSENQDLKSENQDLKAEVTWLNDVITTNITELSNLIANLASSHTDKINHNAENISDLRSNLVLAQFDIGTNSDAITTNSDAITTNSDAITTNSDAITTNFDAITTHSSNIATNLKKINTNIANIKDNKDGIITLNHPPTVGVCGYQDHKSDTGTITYDSLTTDLTTDHSTLDRSTGRYTIHTAGLYSVTWSASVGMDSGERAIIDLYEDGTQLAESFYYSYYGGSEHNIDAGSRTLLRNYCQGTQIRLDVITITADIRNVLFCVHLVQGQEC